MTTKRLRGGTPAAQEPTTPADILAKHGRELEKATKGLLLSQVDRRVSSADQTVELAFYIVAPRLEEYRYAVCRVTYKPASLYPVQVRASDGSAYRLKACKNEEELVGTLKEILQSPPARKVIASLLRESNAVAGEPSAPARRGK
jgi:hypothetical protein